VNPDDVLNLIDIDKVRTALVKAYPLTYGFNSMNDFPRGICQESAMFVLYLLWQGGHSESRLVHLTIPVGTSHWLTSSHDPYTKLNEINYAVDLTIDQFKMKDIEPGIYRKIPDIFFEPCFEINPKSIPIDDFKINVEVFIDIFFHYVGHQILDCQNFVNELLDKDVLDVWQFGVQLLNVNINELLNN
jgi:hypothetical protein